MSLEDIERFVVSKNLLLDDSFLESVKFAPTGCADIKCFTDGPAPDGIQYLKRNLEVMAFEKYLDSSLDTTYLSSSTLAIGLNLKDMCDNINDARLVNLPLMLVSDKKCYVCFIKYDLTGSAANITCTCRRNSACQNNKKFCKNVEKPGHILNDKAVKLAKIISKSNRKKNGIIPFFKYSTFIDYLIWEMNFKKLLERQWDTHFSALRDKYNNNLDIIT